MSVETEYDLLDWGTENVDDELPDSDKERQDHCAWQNEVECEFFNCFL